MNTAYIGRIEVDCIRNVLLEAKLRKGSLQPCAKVPKQRQERSPLKEQKQILIECIR